MKNEANTPLCLPMARRTCVACVVWACALLNFPGVACADEPAELPPAAKVQVDFEGQIAPILKSHCYRCHGPNKQESSFRLDQEAAARKGGDLGEPFIPGDSANSPLIQYVAGVDPSITMPPKGPRLSREEVGLLRAWIDQGAKWSADGSGTSPAKQEMKPAADHWAFKRPVRPAPPKVQRADWPRNPIDHFILARLEKSGLSPAAEVDRFALIRRLSLDLTGLPPTIDEARAFVNDKSPDAYEKLVERLLASPHYGERWALWWLDAARYADTNGYEVDRPRSIWPYRDWVIQAFNADMPFDQFTIEQMAGDMMPGATWSQRVATGFHRNTYMNEEGGHNWEQFRWESIVDRVHTTSTVFLGLTMACAQCHDHKYDPISQQEYYEFFAFLNNADEPHVEATQPKITEQRAAILDQIARLEAELESQFPPYEDQLQWTPLNLVASPVHGSATLEASPDGFFTVKSQHNTDGIGLVVETDLSRIDVLRIELAPGKAAAGTDETAAGGASGPTRNAHGELVLAECQLMLRSDVKPPPAAGAATESSRKQRKDTATVAIREARDGRGRVLTAELTDDDPKTGWRESSAEGDRSNDSHLILEPKKPIVLKDSKLLLRLKPSSDNALAARRFRVMAGVVKQVTPHPELPIDQQRRTALETKFERWRRQTSTDTRHWTVLEPVGWKSKNNATFSKLEDGSLLVSGDRPEIDSYDVVYRTDLRKITGFKLEALPDASLPEYGPGRGSVMEDGTFLLSEFNVAVKKAAHGTLTENGASAAKASAGEPEVVKVARASATYAHGSRTIDKAIDGDKLTGWHVQGGAGRRHCAVFELARPLSLEDATELKVTLLQNFVHQQTLGRFRMWATSDDGPLRASELPVEVEEALTKSPDRWTPAEADAVKRQYLLVAPDLESQQLKIDALRRGLPRQPTSLALQERTTLRPTHQHIRGDFNRPGKEVSPNVPRFLPPLPDGAPRNRLTLARWLVDKQNPLVARVIVNRIWQAYFGRGLVTTPEDFGTQGASPSHPELLDWLACELMANGWSLKHIQRVIVTSAAYRQSSSTSAEKRQIDPENSLLAHGPRFRVHAEAIRDIALVAGGLLNPAIGGASVFPPQPEGVTDLAYGGFRWQNSAGADRYRRGLYTFRKRATPYPAFAVFDAPQQSTCTVARSRTNTPLQALSLLNDEVIVEAAQAIAGRIAKDGPADEDGKLRYGFQLCLTRPPNDDDIATLRSYLRDQRRRFEAEKNLDVARISGMGKAAASDEANARELAAWTMLARVLLNLDETVTKE